MAAQVREREWEGKVCRECGRWFPIEGPQRGFHLNNGKPRPICALCMNAKNRREAQEHPERERARVLGFRHPELGAQQVGGAVGGNAWTDEECRVVSEEYRAEYHGAPARIRARLPHRSQEAIKGQARRMGLTNAGGLTPLSLALVASVPTRLKPYEHDPAYGDPLAEIHPQFRKHFRRCRAGGA
jgi:hypothetical protein